MCEQGLPGNKQTDAGHFAEINRVSVTLKPSEIHIFSPGECWLHHIAIFCKSSEDFVPPAAFLLKINSEKSFFLILINRR